MEKKRKKKSEKYINKNQVTNRCISRFDSLSSHQFWSWIFVQEKKETSPREGKKDRMTFIQDNDKPFSAILIERLSLFLSSLSGITNEKPVKYKSIAIIMMIIMNYWAKSILMFDFLASIVNSQSWLDSDKFLIFAWKPLTSDSHSVHWSQLWKRCKSNLSSWSLDDWLSKKS